MNRDNYTADGLSDGVQFYRNDMPIDIDEVLRQLNRLARNDELCRGKLLADERDLKDVLLKIPDDGLRNVALGQHDLATELLREEA